MPSNEKKQKSNVSKKIHVEGSEYIQNALEKALVDIKYWENWENWLSRLSAVLQSHYRDENISKAIEILYKEIHLKEAQAWKNSFMWALGMPENTRIKILEEAKQKFLLPPENVSYRLMDHLDHMFITTTDANEEDFKKAIREYFELPDKSGLTSKEKELEKNLQKNVPHDPDL